MKKMSPHKVDDVFSGLREYTPSLTEAQLDDFEVRLDKMRYYKFGRRHFNVYYTLLACLCLGVTLLSLVIYYTGSEPELGTGNNIQQMERIEINRAVRLQKPVQSYEVKIKRQSVMPDLPEGAALNDTLRLTSKDSQDTLALPAVALPKEETLHEPVRPVVYVKKRDTIIVYDTTRVKRKRK